MTMVEERKPQLVTNMIKCLGCKTILVSLHRHDFRSCGCGNATSVDGGTAYRRRLGNDLNLIEERSLYLVDGKIKEYADIEEKDILS